jgi:hypothetical protein
MFAATFSDTIRPASCTAAGPPCARLPIRIAITILDSAASAQASMPMSNQLGFFDVVVILNPNPPRQNVTQQKHGQIKTVVSAVLRVKERYRQPMVFAKTEKKTHIN